MAYALAGHLLPLHTIRPAPALSLGRPFSGSVPCHRSWRNELAACVAASSVLFGRRIVQSGRELAAGVAASSAFFGRRIVRCGRPCSEQPSFEVTACQDRGLGAVAARKICQGELVLTEKPLLQLPEAFFRDEGFMLDVEALLQAEWDLQQSLEGLSPESAKQFWDLTDVHTEDSENWLGISDQKTAVGIVLTNAFAKQSVTSGGLFPKLGRFNHSCCPNTYYSWQEEQGEQVLRALRDIEAGEELTLSYTEPYETADDRQLELECRYKFECACQACRATAEARSESDERRSSLAEIRRMLPGISKSNFEDVEKLVLLGEELIDLEFEGSPALKSILLNDALQLASALGEGDLAAEFGAKAYNYVCIAQGADTKAARELQRWATHAYSSDAHETM